MFAAGSAEAVYGAVQFLTGSGPSFFELQGALRAFGHFDQPNPFAGYLTIILPLAVCMALTQSERYGTPLANSLRVMAQENRDIRMQEAEKKAAALPPMLTVPMVLFFLPVLFVVILGPTAIKLMEMK